MTTILVSANNPVTKDLQVFQGTTFIARFEFKDENGEPIDLTGATANSGFRRQYTSNSTVAVFSTTVVNNAIQLALAANATANLIPDRYVYDVKLTYANNEIAKVADGYVYLNPLVS